MSTKNKQKITKENWVSNFNLIGKAKINDYTYKINEKSEKSAWIYNSFNLGVDCGEKHGVVYCEMMGGYSENGNSVIYAHGKNDDGSDNFEQQVVVDWDDRNNSDILETIGDLCFVTVGLERTNDGKTFYKKFLSSYDAIQYINEHLEDGMVLNVKGNIKYSTYNNKTQMKKNITSIVLSKVDSESKYIAKFTQSVLINKDSANLKEIDKNTGVMYVDGTVLDYVKEIGGVEIKGQYPFVKQFEYIFPDLSNGEQCKKIFSKLFKAKKGYKQVNFEGYFIEGGATVTLSFEDLPDDIRDLIEDGVYTKEEALAACATNGNRVQRMVLKKPVIRMVGDEETKTPVSQIFEERYSDDDLIVDVEDESTEEIANNNTSTESAETDSMDWLNNL